MTAAAAANVPIQTVGRFGGDQVRFGSSEAALADLVAAYEDSFAATFA